MRILQTVQDAENWFSDLKEKVTQMEFYVHFFVNANKNHALI